MMMTTMMMMIERSVYPEIVVTNKEMIVVLFVKMTETNWDGGGDGKCRVI